MRANEELKCLVFRAQNMVWVLDMVKWSRRAWIIGVLDSERRKEQDAPVDQLSGQQLTDSTLALLFAFQLWVAKGPLCRIRRREPGVIGCRRCNFKVEFEF